MRRYGQLVVAFIIACGGVTGGDDDLDASEPKDATTTNDACTNAFGCGDATTTFDVITPPPITCPPSAPTIGSACDAPTYEDCEYGTSSNVFCNQHFRCVNGQWAANQQEQSCLAPTDCATAIDGGACTSFGQDCPTEAGSVCACGACGGGPPPPPGDAGEPYGRWHCFSPGAGCASDRPHSGTSCDLPDGDVCRYTAGNCCLGVNEQCADGVWVGIETLPCP